MNATLRTATTSDAPRIANLLIDTRSKFMPYAPWAHPDDELREWVASHLEPAGGVVVAEVDGRVVAIMATEVRDEISWITQMAVDPSLVGRGLGSLLLAHALRTLTPPIRLFTFQANAGARRFYERYGFVAVELTDGQANEERCPDVLYEFRGPGNISQPSGNLPPGQREIESFPRFGLTPFAVRFPTNIGTAEIQISGDVRTSVTVGREIERFARVEQCSDFHCVTTWTRRALPWSGIRFADFYHQIVVPLADPPADATFVVLRGQDGARSSLPLEDLLAPDVLLADRLDGQPLSIAHGAPLRLVAPGHYGYKSVKHLNRIEFRRSSASYRPVGFRFMVHPRARVAYEERGQWIPGWLLRYLYRPLIRPTVLRFERAMQKHLESLGRDEK